MERKAKSATEKIIQRALEEEEAEKRLKKQAKNKEAKVEKVAKKGKTLEQIESEEGGPIKESMVGMAQNKRAAKRKGAAGDTDLVADVETVEEDLEQEEEDGMKLEAFNLKEERQRGYFDESGSYVEKESKDDDVDDAWLQSEEAKVVSAEVRRKIQEQQQRMQAADAAAPLSATQIARLQWKVAQLLLPEETVTKGLKRLGGHSRTARPQKRSKQAALGDAGDGEAAPCAPEAAKSKAQFEELTEAASNLMDAGETDVYSQAKEYFERAAAVYIDLPGPSNLFDAGPSKAAYEDADEDMFASDDEGSKKPQQARQQPSEAPPPAAGTAAPPAGRPPSAPPHAAPAAPAADATDYASWPIKELRRFLTERGQDAAGAVDKSDLVAKVKEVAAAEAAGASQAPPGYAFDPATGYWYSEEAGLHWDSTTGGFFNSATGKWYSFDSQQQQFVEWPQQ